jgi:hypothetical protein
MFAGRVSQDVCYDTKTAGTEPSQVVPDSRAYEQA